MSSPSFPDSSMFLSSIQKGYSAMQMTVALLQMTACSDLAEPLTKGEAFCRRAHLMGADLALFPETWNVVSSLNSAGEDLWKAPERWPRRRSLALDEPDPAAYQRWLDQAVSRKDRFVTHFRELACELSMAIALTYLEAWPPAPRHPRNTVSLIDQHGDLVLTYAKVHTCDARSRGICLYPWGRFPSVYAPDSARAAQGGSDDLLRPGIPRKRPHPHAARGRAHPGSQRMWTRPQPPHAVSCPCL